MYALSAQVLAAVHFREKHFQIFSLVTSAKIKCEANQFPPPNQEKARSLVSSAISNCRTAESLSSRSEHAVRLNGVESGMLQADLGSVFGDRLTIDDTPHALMLPKADSVEHLFEVGVWRDADTCSILAFSRWCNYLLFVRSTI